MSSALQTSLQDRRTRCSRSQVFDQIARVYALDQNDNWIKMLLSGASSTQATVLVPSSYLTTPRFVLFSPVEDFQYAQSILVYSQAVAQAVVNSNFKIDVPVVDIGGGGTIGTNR